MSKIDIERRIDHRIQLMGIRLGPGQEDLRDRMRVTIELEDEERAAYEARNPPVTPWWPVKLR